TVYANIDKVTDLNPGYLTSQAVVDGGKKAAWLFNTYASTVRTGGTVNGITDENLNAGALQAAIWAALYNNSNTITGAGFTLNTTGTIATQTSWFLNQLYAGAPGDYANASATWLDASPCGYGDTSCT